MQKSGWILVIYILCLFLLCFEANLSLQKICKYSPNAFLFFLTHLKISCQSDTPSPLNTLEYIFYIEGHSLT